MQQVKVSELASEFEMKNAAVISELKKVGVWVPSAETPVDHDIADRIRRRLQLMVELAQQEAEKPKAKKKKKKVVAAKARKSIKQLGKVSKGAVQVEDEASPTPLSRSMKPRKGQSSYRTVKPHRRRKLPSRWPLPSRMSRIIGKSRGPYLRGSPWKRP